jgi:hypothetical protein
MHPRVEQLLQQRLVSLPSVAMDRTRAVDRERERRSQSRQGCGWPGAVGVFWCVCVCRLVSDNGIARDVCVCVCLRVAKEAASNVIKGSLGVASGACDNLVVTN